jgi:periplasmic protein TonB
LIRYLNKFACQCKVTVYHNKCENVLRGTFPNFRQTLRVTTGERRPDMSYVSEKKRGNPAGMSAAILFNGSIILAVALSPLVVQPQKPRDPFAGRSIELTPPPEPKKQEEQKAREMPPIFVPKPITDTLENKKPLITTTGEEQRTTTIIDGGGGDDDMTEIVREVIKTPLPIFKPAARDPKFARNFQPDYPVGMLQREIEGSVTVRVLVDAEGHVRQVQVLRATDPDFAKATERQALKAWRFKPATRDGRPVEDWQTLTVRFDIN